MLDTGHRHFLQHAAPPDATRASFGVYGVPQTADIEVSATTPKGRHRCHDMRFRFEFLPNDLAQLR